MDLRSRREPLAVSLPPVRLVYDFRRAGHVPLRTSVTAQSTPWGAPLPNVLGGGDEPFRIELVTSAT